MLLHVHRLRRPLAQSRLEGIETTPSTNRWRLLIAALAMILSPATASHAQPTTIPTGLNPGDQYRLAFVTSTTRDAISADIADYNSFVTAAANAVPELAALATTWRAIGTTTAVDARDNTNTNPGVEVGLPIYRLDDTLLVNDNADLWDGSLLVPLDFNELGFSVSPTLVWTGTDDDGDSLFGTGELGNPALGLVIPGQTTSTASQWIICCGGDFASAQYPLYAISDTLTNPVPNIPAFGPPGLAVLVTVVGLAGVVQLRRGRT